MIDVWTWPTPNGHKVHIALEELGLPYNVIPINIGKGDQFKPEFLAITPNHRIPAIVDPDGPGGKRVELFESGAILIYLSEKTGGRLVHIASQAGAVVELPIMKIMQKRLVITGSTLRPRDADEKARIAAAVERVVWPWIEAGKIKTVIDRTFPLAEAGAALARLEAGGHVGKVVLTV